MMMPRDFKLLVLGRLLTNAADSIYYISTMLYVYHATHNAGITGTVSSILLLLKCFQVFYGPIIDKYNNKRILIITQLSQAALMCIAATAFYFNHGHWLLIVILSIISVLFGEVSYPISNRIVPILIEKDKLVKGNSIITFTNTTMDFILNSLIAALYAIISIFSLYTASSGLFIIAALTYSLINIPHNTSTERFSFKKYKHSLKTGFRIVSHSLLWVFMIGSFTVNFGIGMVYAILPVLAGEMHQSIYYGLFLSSMSIGIMLSTLIVSKLKQFKLGQIMILFFTIAGLFTLSGLIFNINIYLIIYGLSWTAVGVANILILSVSQTILPPSMLGRVSSITSSIGVLGLPIGSFIAGLLLAYIQPLILMCLSGIMDLLLALLWLIHPKLRQLQTIDKITLEDFNIKEEADSPY